ncbi:hypothetical protein ACFFIX_20520 [Metabacillus herbersteinensis]|uniref:MarR family transcriptional regulator n=1 Tax=Metabacillus herbersteinensis TaxID=283816 RepID=A0ABV6GJS9_9BACI
MSTNILQDEIIEYPYYLDKKGDVPFWDHPLLNGYKFLPKDYRPYTTIEAVLSLYMRKRIDDTDVMILKVLGDAICCNEDQLRRYLSSRISRSDVSKRLDKFRRVGLVDRWKVRIRTDEEEQYKPPAPFTLGIAGYKLLKHYYNQDFFMDPNRWDGLGIGAIQRYVAMNELRCKFIEAKSVSNWKWNALIGSNKLVPKPMGVAEIETPRGNLNFLIERAQMSQNFVGFLKDKLYRWKKLFEKERMLKVNEFPDNTSVVVIYTSTLSVAQEIHKQLLLDTYPYKVWVCVEEDLVEDGLGTAFYQPQQEALTRIHLEFFDK